MHNIKPYLIYSDGHDWYKSKCLIIHRPWDKTILQNLGHDTAGDTLKKKYMSITYTYNHIICTSDIMRISQNMSQKHTQTKVIKKPQIFRDGPEQEP